MSSLRARAVRCLLAPFTRRLKTVRDQLLAVEPLESRDNPAPLASINGLSSQDILLGENASFGFTFTNAAGVGAGNTGYAPFIEVAADTSGPDGATSLPTDGYGTPTVTAAGLTLTPAATVLLTTGQTTFTNPLTGEVRPVPAGFGNRDTVYVYPLPFGSFTPGQSTAVSVSVPTSNLADRGTGLPIAVTGGYRDDAPSLAGPGFYGVSGGNNTTNTPDTALAIPELYRFRKVYQGPEDETATGPNFVRRYRLEVDIATGQTLNAVTLTDDLSDTMQIVGRTSARMAAFLAASGLGTNVFSAASSGGTAVTTAPDGTVSYNFGSVTGVAGLDAAFEFDFYIPRDNAGGTQVVPQTPASGTDSTTAQNTASAAATWTPLDGRDTANQNVGKATPDNGPHTLEQQSLAVQKSVTAIDPATGNVVPNGVIRPGSTLLRYTLNFQVSDYYAFDDVFLRDVMGDGQRLFLGTVGGASGFPTLNVSNAFVKGAPGSRTDSNGAFVGSGVIDYQRRYTSGNADSDPTGFPADGPTSAVFTTLAAAPDTGVNSGGRTFLQFNVSDELRARLGANAGLLVGGEIGNDGSGPGNRAFGGQPFGGTTGTIVFYAEVTREFSDAFPSGDPSVDQGDVLRNFADDPLTGGRDGVVGTQLNPATINAANPTPVGTGTDDSGSSVVVPYGVQEKQIYAINSQTVPPAGFNDPPLSLQPGDRVTYRLTYTLPISSFENLRLIDYPPLPVMDVDDSGPFTFIRNPAAYGYLPGQIGVLGSSDTYFSTFDPTSAGGRNPTLSVDSQNNSVTMNFGSHEDSLTRNTTLSLLVTFVVGNQPFASDLFLTNQLRVAEGSTNAGDTTVEDLRRFELVRPFLSVQKGTAAGNSTGFTVGSGANQIAFGGTNVALPGMGTTVGSTVVNRNSAALSGANAISTSGQAASIGGQNIGTGNAPVDAADTVRYAVVAQNSGKGDAFDVTVSDTIQTEYDRTGFDPNADLRVIRGDGTVLTAGVDYTINYNSGTGRFDIDLIDNYTAGNVGGANEDNRSGALSRGERTTTSGDVDVTNGSNTVIVLYDVTLRNTVTPNQLITNVAAVTRYANSEGGGDLTDPAVVPGATDPSDDATVRIRLPQVAKTLVGTEVTTAGNNAANQAVVGEIVEYTLTVTVPEGSNPGATIVDSLQAGLAFVDVTAVSTSAGLTVAGLPTVSANPANTTITSNGRVVTFNLGTVTNSNTNNGVAETITITYRAVVLNTNAGAVDNTNNLANNQGGQTRNNSADFNWTNNAATLPGVPAGRATDLNGALTGTATPVTIVEPTITNAKDVAVQSAGVGAYSAFGQTVRADAGDNIRYRIRLSNPASGSTRANDVTLSDQLPTAAFAGGAGAFSLFGVTVTGAGTVYRNGVARTLDTTDFAIDGAGVLTLNLGFNYDIDPDVQIDLVVQGTDFLGSTGSGVTNLSDVRWTSLDGTPGQRSTHNTNSVERTGADGEIGGGTLNDYRDTDTAVIESPPVVRKDLVATSESHTAGTSVAVGEVVRYRVYVSLPEGPAANFQVQDFLPTGLSFVNDGTARFGFISTGGNVITSASAGGVVALTGGGLDGSTALLLSLPSASLVGTFGDSNIATASSGAGTGDATIYADGADVFFRFGDLNNNDNDTDTEYVVIEFNALVLNVTGNQSGVTRSNTVGVLVDTDNNGTAGYVDVVADANADGLGSGEATVTANDPTNNGSGTAAQSNAVVVTVVEPAVTVAKSVIGATTGDPGDTITFEIVLTAGSGANTTTAFDVAFADLVPSGFENVAFVGGSLSSTGTVTGLGSVGIAGNNVSLSVGSMAAGATVTFRFTATINDNGVAAPAPGSTLTNTGSVTWTSLPGSGGTTANPTGTDTPGAVGSGTGERTGADGIGGALNDYAAADPADVTLNSHSLAGQVYYDANNNGVRDGAEALITGQPIRFRLTGTDTAGNAVDQTVTTSTGVYSFTGLRAGTYAVTQLDQATGYLDGRDTPGTSSPGIAFGGIGTAATDDRGTPATPLRDADAIATIVIGGGASSKAGIDYNFGELLPAQLGDLVFLDRNGNGRQDGGTEVGITGVSVVLTGTDDTGRAVTVTATTAGGLYQFGNLRPGSYTATFGTSDGTTTYGRSVRDSAVATDATDSDGDPVTGTTGGYTLAAGDSNQTVDQGLYVPVSLGNRVFFDQNADGVQDPNEAGLPGAGIEVVWLGPDGAIGGGDDLTFNTVTGANGIWTVGNLPPGNYRVTVTPPAGGPWTLTDSLDNAALNASAVVTVSTPSGVDRTDIDFGYRGTGSIGDTVFLDIDNDGVADAGEGLQNVVVTLTADVDGNGDAETVTATTDTNGFYQFSGLVVNDGVGGGKTYTVDVDETTLPASVNATPVVDPQGPADGTASSTLTTVAPTDLTRDFGYRGVGTLGDTIFLDVNNSGTPDASEGLAGVRVFLSGDLDGDGTAETVTTTTNASGVYQFTGLRTTPAGVTYTVTVDTTTLPQVGPGQPVPNTVDPDGGTANTSAVALTDAAPSNQAQDFGYRNTTSGVIGDTVFLDVNGNGTADPGEGITGVRVRLTADVDGNGTTETFTLTTTATGTYRFENLPVRDPFGTLIAYTVTVDTADLPQGVVNTTDPDGGADSTSTLTLDPNSPVNLNQDFGYRGDGSIGDTVFLDLNNNGVADPGEGITGVTVVLTADVNGDGVQDLTVTATTGPDGEYLFDHLPVNTRTASPINYTVTVTGGLPTGVSNTVDPDGTTDGTWTGTLATGPAAPDRRDIDFGYRGTGRLGDRVWLDANGDGVQDPITSEPSLPNVGFTLTYAGQDGVFGNADDITTTATGDVNGAYQFGHLPAGTFRVTVNTATLPANVTPTFDLDGTATPHAADATLTTGQARTDVDFGYRGAAGLGDRVWLDQNRNNLQDPGEGGIPGGLVELRQSGPDGQLNTADDLLFTATTGANGLYTFGGLPVYGPGGDPFRVSVLGLPAGGLDVVGDLDSPAGSGDSTAAGTLAPNQTRTDVDFGYAGRGAIRGVVFEDVNNDGLRQPGDPAIPGTVLVLDGTDVFGNPLLDPLSGGPLTVTADADGRYAFTNLPPGTYAVREAQPAGYLDGTDTPGSLGGLAGRGTADADRITQIVLPVDGNAVENNFAEIRPARVAGTVYEDRNTSGRQDPSEPGIPGVRVVLTGTDDRGPVSQTLTTDANGNYTFPNLRPGTYTLTQTQPVQFAQGQNTVGTAGGAFGTTDVIRTIVLTPGQSGVEYRFGEIVRQVSPTPALTVEPVNSWETSKRLFLSSSTATPTASVPDFAALGSVNTTRPIQFAATGDGEGGSRVRVYDLTNGRERFRFDPFPGFLGGVRTAVGDLTGDGIPDVVAAAGPGGGPHVVIYNGDTGAVVQSFFAFEAAFTGGSFVAVGDFDGDGTADLAVAADRGGGPRVRVFRSGNPAWLMSDFWGIEDSAFRGGARVAAGDVNGDGRADLLVGAGAGGGPRVAVYDGRGVAAGNPFKVAGDFFAFEPSFTGGVYLAAADLDGDGFAEVITGAGEGGGPRVRALSGRELTAGRVTTVSDRFVFDPTANTGGARVAATDLDGDGRAELFVGTGPGVRPVAGFFNPRTGATLNTFSPNWENVVDGVFVG